MSLSEHAEIAAEKHFLSSINPETHPIIKRANIRVLDHLADQDGAATKARAELAKIIFKKNK